MKIVNILGGLGNQMFQYALLVGLREAFHEEVRVDVSGFSKYHLHNGLELERIFPIKLKQAETLPFHIKKHTLSRYINRYAPFLFPHCQFEYPDYRCIDDIFTKNRGNCYYLGYWQHYKYQSAYREQLLKVFDFARPLNDINEKTAEKMKMCNSIGIHVRRGDYLKHKLYKGICNLDYYKTAIGRLLEMIDNPSFFIFSNDMDWCKENLKKIIGNNEIVYVDWNKGQDSYCDMQLMTFCNSLVIANSSFSWWGAFLNGNQNRIIAPKVWMNTDYNYEIQMPNWIKV